MQSTVMTGRLTRDPEVRYTNGDTPIPVATFTLAVENGWLKENKPDFFQCIAYNRIAELAEKHLVKGSEIYVRGKWHNNNYTNKDGVKVYGMQFTVEEMEFGRRPAEKNGVQTQQNGQPVPTPEPENDFMNIPDDLEEELPY